MAAHALPSQLHRLTLEEWGRMVDSGAFDGVRVELLDGYVVDMSPLSSEHEDAVAFVLDRLIDAVDREVHQIRAAAAMTIGRSEPQPDLMVIPRGAPRVRHPEAAVLVIEVALSSRRRDLVEKPRVYAQAGVARYWVVDLDREEAVEHLDPRGDHFGHVRAVDVLAAPELGLEVALADVLAATRR